MATGRLSPILGIRDLAAPRGVREVFRKLVQLAARCGIAVRLSRLGGALQVRSDLLRDLLVVGWPANGTVPASSDLWHGGLGG